MTTDVTCLYTSANEEEALRCLVHCNCPSLLHHQLDRIMQIHDETCHQRLPTDSPDMKVLRFCHRLDYLAGDSQCSVRNIVFDRVHTTLSLEVSTATSTCVSRKESGQHMGWLVHLTVLQDSSRSTARSPNPANQSGIGLVRFSRVASRLAVCVGRLLLRASFKT